MAGSFPGFLAFASPEQIRGKAREIVSRPDYELESPQNSESVGVLARILGWVLEKLQSFFDALAGLPDPIRWVVVVVLCLALLVLVTHIVVTIMRGLRGIPRRPSASSIREPALMPEDWELAARAAHAQGDFIQAVRQLFLASLMRIQIAENRPFRKGFTNRELLSRYRSTPLFGPLSRFVDVIDCKWYGHETCREEDFLDCRDEYLRIRQIAERRH